VIFIERKGKLKKKDKNLLSKADNQHLSDVIRKAEDNINK